MSHLTLETYYKNVYSMAHQYKFASITELENMIPFERDVYATLIRDEEEKKAEQRKQQEAVQKAMAARGY